jgi:hypothetical protein
MPSAGQAANSGTGYLRNGPTSSPIPTQKNAQVIYSPARPSTSSTDRGPATPSAWGSTSLNTHHRIIWATRNTSTSSRNRGVGRAADLVAFGGFTGWNEQPLSSKSPRTRTCKPEGSFVGGHGLRPYTATSRGHFRPIFCRVRRATRYNGWTSRVGRYGTAV